MRVKLMCLLRRAGLLFSVSLLMAISATGQTRTAKQSGEAKTPLEVVSVGMKVVQDTKPLTIVSWKVVVKNHSSRGIHLYGEVSFRDSEDYEVTGDVFWGDIGGGQQKTFTEELTVTSEQLEKTTKVNASVQER